MSETQKILRHIVLFQFKDNVLEDQIEMVKNEFCQLPQKINFIADFEWGTNNSPENLSQGFSHCFFVSFKGEQDRDDYLPHPEHQKFVKIATPYIEKALVFDYWIKI
jgi:hypothetical protein